MRELTATALAGLLGTAAEPYLLDVREPDEVAELALPGAVNIPLGQLAGRVGEVPAARPVVTVCASGRRSLEAAAFLAETGRDALSLAGGMAAWSGVYDTATCAAGEATVVQVRRRAKGCLSYLVGAGDEAFAVDPSMDLDIYLDLAAGRGWRITRVFDTHLHADHLSGARALAEVAGASLHLNPADPFGFDFTPLADGDRFSLPGGDAFDVAVVHTPGHTEGSTLYQVAGRVVLSGDTLFVDGVGRPDLAERAAEFAANLHASLTDRVLPLGDEVTVLPAHYGEQVVVAPDQVVGASLGELRDRLDVLGFDEPAFVDWATARVSDRPPNYRRIVEVNRRGDAAALAAARPLEVGPNRCSA